MPNKSVKPILSAILAMPNFVDLLGALGSKPTPRNRDLDFSVERGDEDLRTKKRRKMAAKSNRINRRLCRRWKY